MTEAGGEKPVADAAVMCRYGELFLKVGNRSIFEDKLAANARRALRGLAGARVDLPHGRILVHTTLEDRAEAMRRLERVFGIVSLSAVTCVPATLEDIGVAAVAAARQAVARDPALARSFKIEARRSDKRFPHRSYDIAAAIGGQVFEATGIPVDVRTPALVVGVEIRAPAGKGAFIYADTRPGPGGLPVGTAGRGLLLLSGGIDSPAAAWLAAKRGLQLDAVYFHSPPFVGEKTRDKILSLGRKLAEWQACESVTVVNFTAVQQKLREHGKPQLAVVLYRRMMMRIADRIASERNIEALVTGENLSQVASQTVRNMTTIGAATQKLILRPLLTFDKNETIALAQRIGTFDLSTLPYEDCCSLFLPPNPSTGARLIDAQMSERGLDVDALAAEAAATAEIVHLT